MDGNIKIAILDEDRYFSQGLEAIMRDLFIRRGYQSILFTDNYDLNADLVFQTKNLASVRFCGNVKASVKQKCIAIQDFTLSHLNLPNCFHEQVTISRHIKIDALLASVEQLLTLPITRLSRKCSRCTSALTKRERQILSAISQEKTAKQIAKDLGLSLKTVSAHKCAAMAKLGFTRNNDLYSWLRRGRLDKNG
ncbi:helix-turn-helix domain-containing protein [Serratia marcescens]|uniref:helix-turn-helix domain-containing protein n=1 Tax=Serratia marcescens TaxID=615 RepID=UPI001F052C9B|nr:helix-turn-helix transcriptional regulator [Serratia marcescens]MDM1840420.1 helix-turn-helix transcriptional regulator [Serratia marcescens]UMK48129.1 helix-turn-helix transcriptional regulator [Serratia marcescens]HCD7746755.1 helix-turn-helix transcriptional regulator [Serratia marcescens]